MQPVSPGAFRFYVAILAAAALASFAGAPPARAQQPAATSGGLAEVIVTAQKREQNLQEVGISLSAVSGSDLSDRGVVKNDFADHQESPAAIYVDDVYVSQMIGLAFSTFDIDRVEVLRGPQGTLFGRNATGGLAHFISRRPTDEPNGYMDVTFGQRNLLRLEGGFGGAFTDGIDGRIAFQTNHYGRLFKNGFGPASAAENGNDWGLRGQ